MFSRTPVAIVLLCAAASAGASSGSLTLTENQS